MKLDKKQQRERRRLKIRASIIGDAERPRLSVFRSNTSVYLQLIDDDKGVTIVSVNMKEITAKKDKYVEAGKLLAKKALEKKISAIVFDRGGYKYHGRVKSVADGAREGGLDF